MSKAARVAAVCGFTLLGWQWLWQLWLAPSHAAPGWLLASVMSLPILPAIVLWLRRHRQAGFWGAVAALLYFAIGVMEAWADTRARLPGLAQSALAAVVVVAASWDGMRARFSKRR